MVLETKCSKPKLCNKKCTIIFRNKIQKMKKNRQPFFVKSLLYKYVVIVMSFSNHYSEIISGNNDS